MNSINEREKNDLYKFRQCLLTNMERLVHKGLVYDGNIDIDNKIRSLIQTIKTESEIFEQRIIYNRCQEMQEQLDSLGKNDITGAILSFVDDIRSEIDRVSSSEESHNTGNMSCFLENDDNVKMKFLIVEDDFTSRMVLQKLLSEYAECHVAVNGKEALAAFESALLNGMPYDLICLDIMMSEMDGRQALRAIRDIESKKGIGGLDMTKIIMTTALDDSKNIMGAFREGCEAYVIKPIQKTKLLNELRKLGLFNAKVGRKQVQGIECRERK